MRFGERQQKSTCRLCRWTSPWAKCYSVVSGELANGFVEAWMSKLKIQIRAVLIVYISFAPLVRRTCTIHEHYYKPPWDITKVYSVVNDSIPVVAIPKKLCTYINYFFFIFHLCHERSVHTEITNPRITVISRHKA